MKKIILLAFIWAVLSMSVLGTRLVITVIASATHHVYPGQSIQEAINSAESGDMIFVHTGTYYEHVVVNKTVSLIGEDRSTTIIDGSHASPLLGIVQVSASHVTIEGFTIRNSYHPNDLGINLDWSSNSTVRKCIIQNTTSHGIWLGYGSFPEVSYGGHVIEDNLIIKNFYSGVRIDCGNNKVINNNITENGEGIYLTYMYDGHANIISNNTVFNNGWGIYLLGSDRNIISNNNIMYNSEEGIWLQDSDNNVIYHNNFINNTIQASLETSFGNMWVDGYPSSGNYWSDYTGVDLYSGQYQNEVGSDGIGDTSHDIDVDNQDGYPLMGPISFFNAGTWNDTTYYVHIISNSTLPALLPFYFNPDEGAFLRFGVSGETETRGFCRVAIPKDLLWVEDGWTVYYGSVTLDYATIPDENYTYLYFTYPHYGKSTTTVAIIGTHIIPEFPSLIIIPLFMIATLLAVIVYRRKYTAK